MRFLIDFLNRDINDKNELKKTAVATRYCCFLLLIYTATFALVSFISGSTYGVAVIGILLAGYFLVLNLTYGSDIQKACIWMDIVTVIGITATVIWFGWNSGIQHFLFALVLYNILFVRMPVRSQMIGALFVCLLRLGLYFYCREFEPRFSFNDVESVFVQILSTIYVFSIITVCAVNYSIENQDTENTIRKYNRDLEKIAATDTLTQVWNRHKMLAYIQAFFKENEKAFCAVSICDIDYFKKINDTYGHEGGDKVLIAIAKLFSEEMAKCGAVARWGGEEFLLFFTNMNGDEALEKLSEIRDKLKAMIVLYDDKTLQITMTFGLVEYDRNLSIDENIKIADDRLYYGKEKGRDKIVY